VDSVDSVLEKNSYDVSCSISQGNLRKFPCRYGALSFINKKLKKLQTQREWRTHSKNAGKVEGQLQSELRNKSYKRGYSYHRRADDQCFHTFHFLFYFQLYLGFLPERSITPRISYLSLQI
jgi:hypothetical protein